MDYLLSSSQCSFFPSPVSCLDTLHAQNLRLEVNKITSSTTFFSVIAFFTSLEHKNRFLRKWQCSVSVEKNPKIYIIAVYFLWKRCRKLIRKINISSPKKRKCDDLFQHTKKWPIYYALQARSMGVSIYQNRCV